MRAGRQKTLLFAVMLGLILGQAGCGSIPENGSFPGLQEEQPVIREENRLSQLITYFDIAVHLPAREARREYLVQRELMSPGVCDEQLLLAAMLLVNPALKVPESGQFSGLLQPCIENPAEQDPDMMHLARILYVQFAEKQKQGALRRRLVAMKYRVGVLNERLKILNEKLDALKNIERSIRERQ